MLIPVGAITVPISQPLIQCLLTKEKELSRYIDKTFEPSLTDYSKIEKIFQCN